MNNLLVTFEVPMHPMGKGRPRAYALPNGQIRAHTPQRTRRWESDFRLAANEHLPPDIITGPVQVDILAVLRRPKRLMRKMDPDGLMWATVRPDSDNIRKAVLDSLEMYWEDDKQVVAGQTLKVYAEKGGRPRVRVWIGRPGYPHHMVGLVESTMRGGSM